jgi:hypothetical protein
MYVIGEMKNIITSTRANGGQITSTEKLASTIGVSGRAALSVAEFGKLFGRSWAWADRALKTGYVQSVQINKRRVVPVAEVLRIASGNDIQNDLNRGEIEIPSTLTSYVEPIVIELNRETGTGEEYENFPSCDYPPLYGRAWIMLPIFGGRPKISAKVNWLLQNHGIEAGGVIEFHLSDYDDPIEADSESVHLVATCSKYANPRSLRRQVARIVEELRNPPALKALQLLANTAGNQN